MKQISIKKLTLPRSKFIIVIVAGLCGVAGVITTFQSRADTPIATVEAETMTVQPVSTTKTSSVVYDQSLDSFPRANSMRLVTDANAPSGKALLIPRTSSTVKPITTDVAATTLKINAYSTQCKNVYGTVQVSIDGTLFLSQVTTMMPTTYTAAVSVPAGSHELKLTFPNDGYAKDVCDRNLSVAAVSLTGVKKTTTQYLPAKITTDTAASGGKVLRFGSNGSTSLDVALQAATKITLRAKGEACSGDAVMRVAVDGVPTIDTPVTAAAYADYSAPISLATGTHSIAITFPNDAYQSAACDRNLYVDTINFTAAPVVTVPPVTTGNPLTTNPYAANSVWYNALPDSVPLDPNSTNIVANIKAQSIKYYNSFGFNNNAYSPPFFIADKDTPTVAVSFWDCQHKGYTPGGFVDQLKTVPIPANAKPATGTDSEMVIYQPSTQTMYELWKARKDVNGNWQACWGGRMTNMSQNRGIFPAPYGTTATGLPFLGSTIMIDELKAGAINHAVAFAAVTIRGGTYSWPANRTDGFSSDVNTPIEGQRFRLDPSVNVDALNMSPAGKTIAKAIQKYGMILRDKSGNVTVYGESAAPYVAAGQGNPYSTILNGLPTYDVMKGFPWGSVQALAPNYGK